MKILIIGTGNVGTAMAADLTLKGNKVVMLKTTKNLEMEHYEAVKLKGIVFNDLEETNTVKIENITDNYEEAFKFEPELIIVAVQTNYHESIIKNISRFLKKDNILMFTPRIFSNCICFKILQTKHANSCRSRKFGN